MPKKSIFEGNNPVMNFISTPEAGAEPEATGQAETAKTEPEKNTGYKNNPALIESKTRRVQLLIQPTLYEQAKKKAKRKGISVNQFIHDAIEKAVK